VDTSTNVGDIRAAYSYQVSLSGSQAWAYFPDNTSKSGDIWFNSSGASALNYWTPGGRSNFAVLHELGHALGLKHPFESSGIVTTELLTSWDTQSYTIMSYSTQIGVTGTLFSYYPTTPMILDIQAIQYVYGANNSYHTGDDTYSYSDAMTYHETIWDAGGTDTIQYTGLWNSAIDLRPGYGSDIGRNVYQQSAYGINLQSVNNVWIAYNVTIENAIGGSGNDILTGNDADNTLEGGAGNDTMYGWVGNDIFDWDVSRRAGADVFYGGAGDDVYVLDNVNDSVIEYAGEGIDTIYSDSYSLVNLPNVENLTAFSDSTDVTFTGNSAINVLRGSAGNDTLDGGANFDFLHGGLGNDTYIVDNALDLIIESSTLATEIDTVKSSVSYTLGANLENLTLTGTAIINGTGNVLNNTLTGNAANNSLDGGSGNDTIDGGAGTDTVVYSNIQADCTINHNTNGTTTIVSGTDTDTLMNVDILLFADNIVPLSIGGVEIRFSEPHATKKNYFLLTLRGHDADVIAHFSTIDTGTSARAGQDYISTSLTTTIPVGINVFAFGVDILSNNYTEAEETFSSMVVLEIAGQSSIQLVATHTIEAHAAG